MTTATVSSSVTLPRAVRRQLAAIEAESTPASDVENPTQEATEPTAAAPTTAPVTPESPAHSAVQDPRENDPNYWRQRFKVTEGMLRRLQETSAAAINERDKQLDDLRTRIRALEEQGPRSTGRADLSAFFTPEQIDQFGEDQCAAMAAAAEKAARTQAQALIDAEVKPIRQQREQEQQRAQQTREQQFWTDLAEAYPNYAETNADQAWLDWLADEDDVTGEIRQDILDRHRANLSGHGVAKLFQAFDRSRAKPTRTPPVAPSTRVATGASPQAVQPSKGYPSRDEIREFYKRSATGKVTDKERAEFEARLRQTPA